MKYQDVLKRFVSQQAQLLQEKQMEQQLKEQMLAAKAQALGSFIPGERQSPQEEYSETEHNPFEEGQEYKAGGIHIDPSKKGTFKAQATRMGMSIQEAASHILNNKEKYSSAMVKKANFAKNFAKEEGGMIKYPDGGDIRSVIENTSGPRNLSEYYDESEEKFIRPRITGNEPEDYEDFLRFSETAPPNRRPRPDYKYGDSNEYDHYGLWDSLGKPKDFKQALEFLPDWKPDPYDGMYHGFSTNPKTGVFLKAGKPGLKPGDTTWMETSGFELHPHAHTHNLVFDVEMDRFRYLPKEKKQGGEMIRRADGSYSQRGLWDNIRANKGSGKKPTKEMLEQERRINNKYPDGGPIKSMIENTSGPRAEEVDVPLDYQSFIESDVYQPNEKEKIFDTWGEGDNQRTIKGAFYRKDGDKMAIDRLKALYPDGITREEPYDYFNGMHRKFQNELLNTSVNDYANYKDSFLKNEIEGDIPKYADTEDIVKKAYEHNLKNNYDDTDIITSYLNEQAKKQGLGKYDYMSKFYNGSSDAAVARQLLEDYKKKVKK